MRWERTRNILAYPYGWQRPAKTEEWAYEKCLEKLPANPFIEMLCFPWASLIDLERKGRADRAAELIEAIKWTPPKRTLLRVTVIQHIYMKDIIPILQRAGITDVFWSHAIEREKFIQGIRIHPFPLFPATANENRSRENEKKFLYSFIGAYTPGLYLTKAREWILDLPICADTIIRSRGKWHFEDEVYGEQVHGIHLEEKTRQRQTSYAKEYQDVMQASIFTLCPSGAGPNTIRFWESIAMDSIPVLISDDCWLPGHPEEWKKAIIRVPETMEAAKEIPHILREAANSPDRITAMRSNLAALKEGYGTDALAQNLSEFVSKTYLEYLR
jgi:hypothetical protein